jgi:hypothetical protein
VLATKRAQLSAVSWRAAFSLKHFYSVHPAYRSTHLALTIALDVGLLGTLTHLSLRNVMLSTSSNLQFYSTELHVKLSEISGSHGGEY